MAGQQQTPTERATAWAGRTRLINVPMAIAALALTGMTVTGLTIFVMMPIGDPPVLHLVTGVLGRIGVDVDSLRGIGWPILWALTNRIGETATAVLLIGVFVPITVLTMLRCEQVLRLQQALRGTPLP